MTQFSSLKDLELFIQQKELQKELSEDRRFIINYYLQQAKEPAQSEALLAYLNQCIDYKHPFLEIGINWSPINAIAIGLDEYNNYLRKEGYYPLPIQPKFTTVIKQCEDSGLTQPFNCDDLPSEKNHREMLAILDKTMGAVQTFATLNQIEIEQIEINSKKQRYRYTMYINENSSSKEAIAKLIEHLNDFSVKNITLSGLKKGINETLNTMISEKKDTGLWNGMIKLFSAAFRVLDVLLKKIGVQKELMADTETPFAQCLGRSHFFKTESFYETRLKERLDEVIDELEKSPASSKQSKLN